MIQISKKSSQVTSEEPIVVTAIKLQGDGIDSYVTEFEVSYRLDESDEWLDVLGEDGEPLKFAGSTDASEIKEV